MNERVMDMEIKKLNDLNAGLTKEELRELEAAAQKEPVFDDDSPPMDEEQLKQFKRERK